jgi:hypothetical protein
MENPESNYECKGNKKRVSEELPICCSVVKNMHAVGVSSEEAADQHNEVPIKVFALMPLWWAF